MQIKSNTQGQREQPHRALCDGAGCHPGQSADDTFCTQSNFPERSTVKIELSTKKNALHANTLKSLLSFSPCAVSASITSYSPPMASIASSLLIAS